MARVHARLLRKGSPVMDLRFTDEENAFRDEVRTFMQTQIPEEIRRRMDQGDEVTREDMVRSQRILNARGWAVPRWPVEWGGQDWTPVQHYIFLEELQLNAVPPPLAFNCDMVGPVIANFGNEEQKRRFLPRIANIDDWWCQGFSEPGAGSDLASLKTRAVREGDHYIVNGQKTWTTLGQYADWIFCLVRTDTTVKQQEGISFLLIDMKTPGVTVRPIITIDGRHEVNEVFFDDVKVPVENLVGEENKGWNYAKFLLGNERVGIARVGMTKRGLSRIREIAKQTPAGEGTVWDDAAFRQRYTMAEIELKALEITQMRIVSQMQNGAGDPRSSNAAASILKIKGSELQQTATELLLEAAGPHAIVHMGDRREHGSNDPLAELEWAALASDNYFNFRKVTIYGGSNEIQRNIIAKMVLGL
jgi:pimeloyl-CoA dehydrogenase large subunit